MPEPRISRGEFLRLGVLTALPGFLSSCLKREKERVVNFFNWSAYIAQDTLPGFTRQTGVKVNYDVFADEDEMFEVVPLIVESP